MNTDDPHDSLGDDERLLIAQYHKFYESLESGSRVPSTAAQRHFVAVCRGQAVASTPHERAWHKYKRLTAGCLWCRKVFFRSQLRGGLCAACAMSAQACECGKLTPNGRLCEDCESKRRRYSSKDNDEVEAGVPRRHFCAICGKRIPPDLDQCWECSSGTEEQEEHRWEGSNDSDPEDYS